MNIVDGLKNLLLDLTIGRADKVATVDKWDGSASNYADTDAYCKACLIDVNPTGDKKKQSHCMLPVRKPGSSQMADKAIFAVAGGRGISAVKKPSNVDQDVWDKAVTKAAKQIEGAYYNMNKPVPNTVKDMLGIARSVSIDSLFQQIQTELWDDMGMYGSIQKEYGYLSTVYIDNGELYALFTKEGLFSRSHLTIDPANDLVTLGPLEDVSQTFTPVQRSTVSVTRGVDGSIRLFLLAGTALINRVGQIDSTALYDDMIQRAEDCGYYPTFDFYHLGQDYPSFEFGQTDWLGRDGVCYLATGMLDPDHWLTEPVARAIEEKPEDWGASIEFYPLVESIEFIEVDNLKIPVFKRGLNVRISILPEANAAAWFTTVGLEKRAMNKQQEDALKKLLGDAEYTKRMGTITAVNGTVDREKLIFRSTDQVTDPAATTTIETTTTETTTTETAPSGNVLEVDETMLGELTNSVMQSAPLITLTDSLTAMQTTLTTLTGAVQTLQNGIAASVARMNTRLDQLETDDQEHSRIVAVDSPRKNGDLKLRMVYRPSGVAQRQAETITEIDYDAQVQNTLDTRYPKVGI